MHTYALCVHVAYVACRRNYTYKGHTRRRQVTVAPARRTDSRRVLLDDAPVDGRTDAHIPVIVLSQEEAGPALSASLALDSYREGCFLHDLRHLSYISFPLALLLPLSDTVLLYCLRIVGTHPVCLLVRDDSREMISVPIIAIEKTCKILHVIARDILSI